MTSVWAAPSESRDLAWTVIELMRAVARQRVLDGGQRRDRHVVLVGGPAGALGVGLADHLEVGPVDLHGRADRVGAAEQLLDDGRADHQHPRVLASPRRW